MAIHDNESQHIILTINDTILSNKEELLQDACTSEEADPRLIRHAISQFKTGIHQIIIKTVDTDVLISAISYSNFMVRNGATHICGVWCWDEYSVLQRYRNS